MPRRQFNLQRHRSIQWIYAVHIGFQFSTYVAVQFAQMIFNCIAVMDLFHFSTMRSLHTFFAYKFHLIVIQLGVIVLNGLLNQSFKSSFRIRYTFGCFDGFDCSEMKNNSNSNMRIRPPEREKPEETVRIIQPKLVLQCGGQKLTSNFILESGFGSPAQMLNIRIHMNELFNTSNKISLGAITEIIEKNLLVLLFLPS